MVLAKTQVRDPLIHLLQSRLAQVHPPTQEESLWYRGASILERSAAAAGFIPSFAGWFL